MDINELDGPSGVQATHTPLMELVGDYSDEQRHWMQVAWDISNHDEQFLYLLKAENGELSPDRQSDVFKNGLQEDSWGFCQIHRPSHPEIVNDPRFFSDPQWQLEQCHALFIGGGKVLCLHSISK